MVKSRSAFLALVAVLVSVLMGGARTTVLAQPAPTTICTSPAGGFTTGSTFTCIESLGQGGTAATVNLSTQATGAFFLIGISPIGATACATSTAITGNGTGGTASCAANTGFFTGISETFAVAGAAPAGTALTQTTSCAPAVSALTGRTLTAGPGSCGSGAAATVTTTAVTPDDSAVTVGMSTGQPSSLISVSVDRGNGATYYAGEPITICVELDFSGPNIYQSGAFPVRLTDRVAGNSPVLIFEGFVPATGQQCLTRAISAPFGNETITGEVRDPLNGTRIATATATFISASRPNPLPPQVMLTPSATTAPAGQPISFAVTATPSSAGASIQSLVLNFGDGTVLGVTPGTTATHAYASPGTYTVTLTAVDTAGAAASTNVSLTIASGTPPPPPGASVTYSAGWNLIGGPAGTVITGNLGPLYTFQPGASVYAVVPSGTPLNAGLGYWAYFSSTTTQLLAPGFSQTLSRSLPAGQWVMLGNPGRGPATVSGADFTYTYDPARGYVPATTLQPGQGIWVLSLGGGTITITSAGP